MPEAREPIRSADDLARRTCVPCKKGGTPLKGESLASLLWHLDGWTCVREHHLEKEFRFKDFAQGLAFVNEVGRIAEAEGHHPDLYLAWGLVRVTLWTHKIDGLSESDFVMAAKIDRIGTK
jgi:4a-hydroxytetrahydrobiopterin dehydratase